MKNLQRLLIAAAFASIIPSMAILCSEEPKKTTEMNILKNISYVSGVIFACKATSNNALMKVKTNLADYAWSHRVFELKETEVMEQLTKQIKVNTRTMGVSCLAILAPVIIPAAVDKINAINKQNTEINKELTQETV